MAADMVNMMAGSSMTTAAPTLVWKNPIAASQPLQGARERVGAGSPAPRGAATRRRPAACRGPGSAHEDDRGDGELRTRRATDTPQRPCAPFRRATGHTHTRRGCSPSVPRSPPPRNAAAAQGTSSCAPWRPRSGTAATRRRAELTLDLSGRREAEPSRHGKVPRHPRVTGPREGRPLVPHAGLAGRGGGKHGVLEDVFLSSNKIARFRSQETSDDTRETASPAAPPR